MKRLITHASLGLTLALSMNTGHAQETQGPSPLPVAPLSTAPGYLVANFTIRDPALFQKYRDAVRPITLRYGGRPVVFTANAQKVEGNPQMVMAVMRFPSLADVERFYFSPEYTEVKKLRIASTEGSLVLTEGFVAPQQ